MKEVSISLDALVCDLDGVVYRGSEPVTGASAALDALRDAGIKILFATNNATKTPERYVERLEGLGVAATPQDLVTSAVVTAEEISRRGWSGRRVFVIGGDGIISALRSVGMSLVDGAEARGAEVVVASGSSSFDYEMMKTAAFAVRNGAEFLATNDDPTFPAADGLWPGAGATVAAIETASGRKAEVVGKPYRPMMEAIARRLVDHRRIAVVGDQAGTDLAGARLMGWMTILVLSGVTSRAQADALRPPPDLIVPSLVELQHALTIQPRP